MSDVTVRYPTGTDEEREKAVSVASLSIQRGELIILPTDTVYGLAADAFDADAVGELLEAKGRGREMPPPILVSSPTTLDALAVRVPAYARALVAEFWPGPLTIVCHQQTSLQWDLGDTRGTVAIRMPDHDIAREILERTGPLAVSSANLTGRPAATTADEAEEMLGDEVAAIVDAGPATGGLASTIVDATGDTPRVLREGALSLADLDTVLTPLGLSLTGQPAPDPVVARPAEETVGEAAPTTKAATKKATKKAPTKKAPTTKAAAKKAPVKKAAAPKVTTKKTPAKKSPGATLAEPTGPPAPETPAPEPGPPVV